VWSSRSVVFLPSLFHPRFPVPLQLLRGAVTECFALCSGRVELCFVSVTEKLRQPFAKWYFLKYPLHWLYSFKIIQRCKMRGDQREPRVFSQVSEFPRNTVSSQVKGRLRRMMASRWSDFYLVLIIKMVQLEYNRFNRAVPYWYYWRFYSVPLMLPDCPLQDDGEGVGLLNVTVCF